MSSASLLQDSVIHGMQKREYQTLYELEETYWWFRGLRAAISSIIGRQVRSDFKVLDVGAGTGFFLSWVSQKYGLRGYGFDVSPEAVPYWKNREFAPTVCGSINQIPFLDETFDFIFCIDVLECISVHEEQALHEIYRSLKNNGKALLVVPAYAWLYSKEHDSAVRAFRRYRRRHFKNLLEKHQLKVLRISYLFPTLFPLIAFYRILERLKQTSSQPESNIKRLPFFLNNLFTWITIIEAKLLRLINFNWGSSVIALVQKKS